MRTAQCQTAGPLKGIPLSTSYKKTPENPILFPVAETLSLFIRYLCYVSLSPIIARVGEQTCHQRFLLLWETCSEGSKPSGHCWLLSPPPNESPHAGGLACEATS